MDSEAYCGSGIKKICQLIPLESLNLLSAPRPKKMQGSTLLCHLHIHPQIATNQWNNLVLCKSFDCRKISYLLPPLWIWSRHITHKSQLKIKPIISLHGHRWHCNYFFSKLEFLAENFSGNCSDVENRLYTVQSKAKKP